MNYRCYLLTHVSKVRHTLLVIDLRSDCSANPGACCRAEHHDAVFVANVDKNGLADWVDCPTPAPDDKVWPTACARCKRLFAGDVMKSTMQELIYRTDDGKEMTISEAPIGAMWNEPGHRPLTLPSEDGLCLVVKTPGGNWCVDGPSWENGVKKADRAWKRTGTPPNITANPSIHILTTGLDGSERRTVYHGWLRDGVLIDA